MEIEQINTGFRTRMFFASHAKMIVFDYTDDDIVHLAEKLYSAKNCEYCGVHLIKAIGYQGKDMVNFDRRENGCIQNIDDICITCARCNTTKGNKTFEQFIDNCEKKCVMLLMKDIETVSSIEKELMIYYETLLTKYKHDGKWSKLLK